MATPASTGTFGPALKQALPDKKIEVLSYKDNPAFAMIPKRPTWEGSVMRFVVWHGGNQGGVSALFSEAQANKSAGLTKSFNLTTVKKYGLTSIETELLLAAKSDKGAFLKASVSEVEQTLRNVSNDIGMHMFRNHGGARGQVGSTSSMVLTLKQPEDIVHFEVDMVIVSDDTDGTSGAADTEEATISAVDIDAGTISRADADWTTGGNFANDDYLFRVGDFGVCIAGFDSWIPATAPDSTAFFGVDRSADPTRLGGMRYIGTAGIEETLLDACVRLQRLGGSPDVCFVNHTDFAELRKELGSRIQYNSIKATSTVPLSFKGIELPPVGNGKPVMVLSDRNCQKGVAWLIQLNTWAFASRGKAPHLLTAGAAGSSQGSIIWEASADAIEIRSGYYGNLGCWAPGYNARVALPTSA